MRLYEIVYIFDAESDQDTVSGKLDTLHALLTGGDGEITAIDHWGVRQLAYPINKQKSGYYVVVHFRTEAEALPEFERRLTLETSVMRYLIVVNEGEPAGGNSVLGERPVKPSDEEEAEEAPAEEPAPEATEASSEGSEEGGTVAPRSGPPEFQGGLGRRRRMEGPPIELLNYKDVSTLSRFMTEQGKILPKRTTKVTARFQRQLGRAIKRARFVALVPYVQDHEA